MENEVGGDIAFVGRLSNEKGPIYALKTLHYLKRRYPKAVFSLMMAGDGPELENLKHYAKVRGLEDDVHFNGLLPREQVGTFLMCCDIVFIPSKEEAFGLVALEAMREGRPIVAARVGGLQEVVTHGRNGLLVRQGNIRGYAEAIYKLVSDFTSYRIIVENNLGDVQNYSWKRCMERYEAAYTSILLSKERKPTTTKIRSWAARIFKQST